jgi:transitional endoplasmic reticulum ATPase
LAHTSVGYVGADIQSVCRHAIIAAIKQYVRDAGGATAVIGGAGNGSSNVGVSQLTLAHFEQAMLNVPASSQRGSASSLLVRSGSTSWSALGGLVEVKQQLQRVLTWPLQYRDTYSRLALHPPRGIILYGPPGCAKTSLVRCLAANSYINFLTLDGAALYNCFLGESERIVRDLFARARAASPAIVFLDEIDSIVTKRAMTSSAGGGGAGGSGSGMENRILSTLLNEMDGIAVATDILVVATTNRIDMIDDALLRPGRFDQVLYIPPPDHAARCQILSIYAKSYQLSDQFLAHLALRTANFSGADLANLCREAAFIALRQNINANSVVILLIISILSLIANV